MSRACGAVQDKLLEHPILCMKCLVPVLEDGWTRRQCGMWMETSIFLTGVQEERQACLSSGGCSTSPSHADSYVVHDTAGKIEIFLDCYRVSYLVVAAPTCPTSPSQLSRPDCRIVEHCAAQQSGDWRPTKLPMQSYKSCSWMPLRFYSAKS